MCVWVCASAVFCEMSTSSCLKPAAVSTAGRADCRVGESRAATKCVCVSVHARVCVCACVCGVEGEQE